MPLFGAPITFKLSSVRWTSWKIRDRGWSRDHYLNKIFVYSVKFSKKFRKIVEIVKNQRENNSNWITLYWGSSSVDYAIFTIFKLGKLAGGFRFEWRSKLQRYKATFMRQKLFKIRDWVIGIEFLEEKIQFIGIPLLNDAGYVKELILLRKLRRVKICGNYIMKLNTPSPAPEDCVHEVKHKSAADLC